jgi:rubrerythrin
LKAVRFVLRRALMIAKTRKETLIKILKIVEKGIQMEKHARDFYADAARVTSSPEGKKMFLWLSQFEVGHKRRLELRRDALLELPELKGYAPENVENYKVSETSESGFLPDIISDEKILRIALENEKRAYAFFQKKITFADEDIKETFKTMGAEEEKHIQIIEDQLKHLKLTEKWKEMEDWEDEGKKRELSRQ